jgi:Fic family protein
MRQGGAVDRSEFRAPRAGRIVVTSGGYAAFVPSPLPPRLTYTRDLVVALSRADSALGELSGVGGEFSDPELLGASFERQEALCSSRIEGSDVTLSDVLLDQVAAAPQTVSRKDLGDVRECVATLRLGVTLLEESSLSMELVRELHGRLLRNEVGGTRMPGAFRTEQNWIGPPGSTLATATYVPPPAAEMRQSLAELDTFMQERGRIPDLVQCALVHQQFESIHPFVGGNGRLGRLLITLFLIDRGRLRYPLLYLSAYLETHRDEYYALLQRVRTHGEWVPWLAFFAEGVRETAERAARQARALIRLHERADGLAKGREQALAAELFRTPCMTVSETRRVLGSGKTKAHRVIAALELAGLLVEYGGTRRPRVFLAAPVLDAVMHPLEDLRRRSRAGSAGAVIKSGAPSPRPPSRRADLLMAEAMRMVDVAKERGVRLRLAGGLAVRRYCVDLDFVDREYSDVDFVGQSEQRDGIGEVFAGLGYAENRFVSQATESGQMQFVRREVVTAADAAAARPPAGDRVSPTPLVDHVDVFVDIMRMDHDIDVRDRLDCDEYAISPADAFIAKLQIGRINQKDVHDVVALLKDLPVRATGDGLAIDASYIAEVCARDWGLYRDVTTNIALVLERLDDYGLPAEARARVRARLTVIGEALEEQAKSLRWWLRARVGERVAWRREVEDAEGTQVIAPQWDWRRDLG